MDYIIPICIILWAGIGAYLHIRECNKMKTWRGTPVWQEPFTYLMFFPAGLAGPLLFFVILAVPIK
jgi:hypothetical protein